MQDLNSSGATGPVSPFKGATRPPAPAADFALRDQNGDLVQLSQLRGKVVVLTPLYTHCQDLCPLTAQQVRGETAQVGAERGSDLPAVGAGDAAQIEVDVDPGGGAGRRPVPGQTAAGGELDHGRWHGVRPYAQPQGEPGIPVRGGREHQRSPCADGTPNRCEA